MSKIICLNLTHQEYFNDRWKEHCKELAKSNKEIGECGEGWLAGIAAHSNLCIATERDKENNLTICAADLWKSENKSDSPYLCKGHRKLEMSYVNSLPKKKVEFARTGNIYIEPLKKLISNIKEKLNSE